MGNSGEDNSLLSQANQPINQTADDSQNLPPVTQDVQVPISSSVQKEYEPQIQVQASEKEPYVDNELKKFGVEAKTELPKLDKEHEKIGVMHAKESVSVQTVPQGIIQSSMTMAQAKNITKMHKKIGDSVLWLAILILRQFKKEKQ